MPAKLKYEQVKKHVEIRGYTLVSEHYINRNTKLDMICDKGHHCSISYGDFTRPSGCKTCKAENAKIRYSTPKEEIEKLVSDNNYILKEIEYKNHRTYLHIICPNGHNRRMELSRFKSGGRCKVCADKEKKLSYEYVKEFIHSRNYTLISEKYTNSASKLKIKCHCGHVFEKSFFDFSHQYQPCPRHRKDRSKGEIEVVNVVKEHYTGPVLLNDRSLIINPKTQHYLELDIWLPDLRKAIEYSAFYYHKQEDVIYRDDIKRQWCIDNNVNILYIDDLDWKKNKEIELNRIKTFLKE